MIRAVTFASALFLATTFAHAGVVQPIGAYHDLLIPAAASTPGLNSTFFRSDIAIINLRSTSQTVRLEWLSQNGASNLTRFIDINASSGIRSADFVSEVLGTTGVGSIAVTAMTSQSGSIDTSGRLAVNARIWTPQSGTDGTTSQSFPVIPVTSINTPLAALFAVGGGPAPDDASRYRVNIGVVNLADTTQTFAIFVPGPTAPVPVNVTVPPHAMEQVPLSGGVTPSTQVIVQNTTGAGQSNSWVAYQSTVNNVTGDAWSELGVPGNAP